MKPAFKLAPSILAADLANLHSEIKSVEAAGADMHHLDVMDGHFVPNLSFGLPILKVLRGITQVPLDVHLMVSNPDAVVDQYIEASPDSLSFHVEAAYHHHRLLSHIKSRGIRAGIAINPGTSLEAIRPLLCVTDFVMMMSVNPGFGGQRFIAESIDRIKSVRSMVLEMGLSRTVEIEVDGGIDPSNIKAVVDAGATIIVAGSSIYGAAERQKAVAALHRPFASGS